MNKRFSAWLSLLLSLLLCLSCAVGAFAGEDDFTIEDGRLVEYKGEADKIVVPEGVTTLGEGCLSGKKMTEVVLPDSLEVIEDWVFSWSENLRTVTIPKNVKEIGIYVFDGDSSLTAISVAAGNPSFKSVDGVLFDKAGELVLKFPEGKATAGYQLPETVKIIGAGAFFATDLTSFTAGDNVEEIRCWSFSECEEMTSFTAGKGLKKLGDHVFSNSQQLAAVSLPAALEEVGVFVFDNCAGLKAINVAEGGQHFVSTDGVLYNKGRTTIVKYPDGKSARDFELPDTVKRLEVGSLTRCDMTEIDLSNVTYICSYALNECKALKNVVLGAGLTHVGQGAFANDTALKDVWYGGTADLWDKIDIEGDNQPLKNAEMHYGTTEIAPPPDRIGTIGDPWKPEDLPPAGNIIFDDDWGDDLPYTLDDNGTLTISGAGATFGYVTVEFQTGWWSPGMPLPTWSPLHYYKDDIKRVVLTNGLTILGPNVFYQCDRITDVYFDGTQEEWNAIDIREGNETLTGATIHFKYVEPPHEHDWGEPVYTWSEDNAAVTATRVCRGDDSHVETETVNAVKTVAPATCTEEGKTTYTATFTNAAFTEQTKEVVIPATGHNWGEPTYTWSADNATVTAVRTCKHDATHTETETVNAVPTETEPGKITYTATFENPAFAPQSREVVSEAAYLPGDVDNDGDVTPADARLALRASVRLEIYEEGSAAFTAADVDGSGEIKPDDARLILRASVKLEDLNQLKKKP